MKIKFLATPKTRGDCYPWRPMDNKEKRAIWALKYYLRHAPYGHPVKVKETT